MTVLRVEVDEVRENEIAARLTNQIDRLAHAVRIRLGADLRTDPDTIEDVGDLSECDHMLPRLRHALDRRLSRRRHREVFPVRGSLEATFACSDKRPGDDPSEVVLAAHELARDRTDPPQLLDRNDLFVCG